MNGNKDKRGAAIETAVAFLAMISLFCMLLVTLALSMDSQSRLVGARNDSELELERITDVFAHDAGNVTGGAYVSETLASDIAAEGDLFILTVRNKSDGRVVMVIEKQNGKLISRKVYFAD